MPDIGMSSAPHLPVLLDEVIEAVAPRDGDLIVDATFGAGGYTRALLDAARCDVLAIDRDPTAIAAGADLVSGSEGRLTLIEARFSSLADILDRCFPNRAPAAIVLDIGVSSMQLDRPERGFSFQADGPLDMRMGGDGPTAADLVNTLPEADLADVLFRYGEERQSRRIARAIVHDRATAPFTSTAQLAGLVACVLKAPKGEPRHPATRTFQALRICVNDELGELQGVLEAAETCLASGGRLAVVTFHSLEDGIVKRFLRDCAGLAPRGSRHEPLETTTAAAPTFRLPSSRPIEPSADEIARNPRARSARLRLGVRTSAPGPHASRRLP
jgi:16S rRNA (cytosine1402-N4)-methyltransferase